MVESDIHASEHPLLPRADPVDRVNGS
jgi:hypothetical protein